MPDIYLHIEQKKPLPIGKGFFCSIAELIDETYFRI